MTLSTPPTTALPSDTTTATPDAPAAGPATRSVPPRVRAALAVTAAAVAFAPSLAGLVADLRYGAPTGDLVVVPVVAALMLDAVVRARPRVWDGRLGHGDLVAAAALAGTAALLLLVPAGTTTNGDWLTRLDLLAHPFALAAFAVLLLGLRSLAVALVPLAYGVLVWPWPVTWLNVHAVAPLTRATYEASGFLAELVGTAQTVPGAGTENTLRITHGTSAFEVVVAPACSGITGISAYLVVAGAVLALTHGRLHGRAAWTLCGVAAVWVVNVVRIVGLTAAGTAWGPDVALDLLHPVAGLVLDGLVVVALVAALGRFGLTWRSLAPAAAAGPVAAHASDDVLPPPPARSVASRGALVAVLALALLAATTHVNGGTDPGVAAAPRHPVDVVDVAAVGPDAAFSGEERWSKVYFGDDSTWNRYRVGRSDGAAGTVWVDSLVVTDADALRAHDVFGCYNFHGARITRREQVRLPGRVDATRLVVVQADGERWQTLFWEWPLLTDAGLRYERVTLFLGGLPPAATPGGAPAAGAVVDVPQEGTDDVAQARAVVAAAAAMVRSNLHRGAGR